MWYTGVTIEEVTIEENGEQITHQVRVRQVGYATSPDGIQWTKYPGNPVFTPLRNSTTWEEPFAVDQTHVLPDPLQGYHMFYFSGWSIGHAYSPDGIRWERDRDNPILQYQPDTGQGVLMFGGPTALLKDDTVWLYFMHSAPGARRWGDGEMRIGLAAGP